MTNTIPENIKPLVWYVNSRSLDVNKDKNDIILNVVNEGTMEQWRWLANTYGKDEIKSILQQRLATELHPESRNLAEILFDVMQDLDPKDSTTVLVGEKKKLPKKLIVGVPEDVLSMWLAAQPLRFKSGIGFRWILICLAVIFWMRE